MPYCMINTSMIYLETITTQTTLFIHHFFLSLQHNVLLLIPDLGFCNIYCAFISAQFSLSFSYKSYKYEIENSLIKYFSVYQDSLTRDFHVLFSRIKQEILKCQPPKYSDLLSTLRHNRQTQPVSLLAWKQLLWYL